MLTPNSRLTRDEAAIELRKEGYPVSPKTLANLASQGKGPPYQLFGRASLYRWGDALAWAESRLSAPCRSTSEAEVQRAA